MSIRATIRTRLQRAIERRRLTYAQVAQRAGVNPRTVQRLLEGETFAEETVDAVAQALGIEVTGWDEAQVVEAVQGAMRGPAGEGHSEGKLPAKSGQEDSACPVVGWKSAARAAGVSARTLRRLRDEHGDPARRPWWKSEAACREWFERMIGEDA